MPSRPARTTAEQALPAPASPAHRPRPRPRPDSPATRRARHAPPPASPATRRRDRRTRPGRTDQPRRRPGNPHPPTPRRTRHPGHRSRPRPAPHPRPRRRPHRRPGKPPPRNQAAEPSKLMISQPPQRRAPHASHWSSPQSPGNTGTPQDQLQITGAQRHADEGVAPDVLRDLMGYDSMQTTLKYYRVTEKRVRAAIDPSQHPPVRRQRAPGLSRHHRVAGPRTRPDARWPGRRPVRHPH